MASDMLESGGGSSCPRAMTCSSETVRCTRPESWPGPLPCWAADCHSPTRTAAKARSSTEHVHSAGLHEIIAY